MAEVTTDVRAALDALNAALRAGEVTPYRLELYDPAELQLAKRNARFMAPSMFRQLVANIQADGQLESLPLIYTGEKGDERRVISGNHRVMAARKARIPLVLCLVIDHDLSKDRQIAKQLAHNALTGQDDLAILKELWAGIEKLDAKVYSGIDERTVKLLQSAKFPELKEEPLRFKVISLTFLPEEADAVKAFLTDVLPGLPGDEVWLGALRDYRRFFDTVVAAKGTYDVVNTAAAVLKLVEVCQAHLGLSQVDPMEGVRKTEVRFGEVGLVVPTPLYRRFRVAWDALQPREVSASKAAEAAFEQVVRLAEAAAGIDSPSSVEPSSEDTSHRLAAAAG